MEAREPIDASLLAKALAAVFAALFPPPAVVVPAGVTSGCE